MINRINFCGNIYQINNTQRQNPIKQTIGEDTFTRSKSAQESAIEYAKNKIIETLKQNQTEYAVAIDQNGTILDESEGDNKHCSVNTRKLTPNCKLIHGHPVSYPLSSGDISVLLSTDAESQEAITIDGKYSRLTKKHPLKIDDGYSKLYSELEKQLCIKVLKKLGIPCETTREDLINMYKDFMVNTMGRNKEEIEDEEAINSAKSLDIDLENADIKSLSKQLKNLMSFYILMNPMKYDKEHNAIIQNLDKINQYFETPEGLETRHEFVQDIADQYDLIYETDLFD